MTQDPEPPPLPWASTREARRAERSERRRERRADRDDRHDARRARPSIQPEAIVEAAIRIIDAGGTDALTIRRLAADLGVGAMTLYWYVRNKDELLDLVVDRVAADVALPGPNLDWRVRARMLAEGLRATLSRHRGGIAVVTERPFLGPNSVRLFDVGLGIFKQAGFDDGEAAHAYFCLSAYVMGACLAETSSARLESRPDLSPPQVLAMVRDYLLAVSTGRYPNVQAFAVAAASQDMDERFAFGLESLLDGFDTRVAALAAGPVSGG